MNERLKHARKALGLSQIEMAKALGIGQSTYCQFETGVRPLQARYINSLQSMYNVNPEWLKTGEGDMFIKSSKDEEFFAAYESLTDDSKKLIYEMIMKLKKADE